MADLPLPDSVRNFNAAPALAALSAATLPTLSFQGFIVETLCADGTWRAIEDSADEPKIVPTEEHARDLAAAWSRLGVSTRYRSLTSEPAPAEMADMWDACPRPDLSSWFTEVSCSKCGLSFGPGPHGFSSCLSHRGLYGEAA